MHRRDLTLMPLAAFAARPPEQARAQGGAAAWPARPVRLVVPFAPGGAADVVSRLFAQPLSAALGQPVVAENRPGAGGTIGADAVAKAAPDGHTLVLSNIQPHAVAPAVYPAVPYDPVRDFTHLALLTEIPLALVVAADSPVRDLGQFVALARRTPGGLRVGTNGNGSSAHVSLELLKRLAGVELVHVPYRGSAAMALTEVLAGRIEAALPSLGEASGNERLRILTLAAPERLARWPGVPTFREAGYPEMVVSVWFGFSGPAGLPDAVADRLHREARDALARPEVAARLAEMGSGPDRGLSRTEFAAFVAREAARWAELARASGARAE
jgi:tripartite-type tricarboxylate transporter receptor subunit TctC